MSDVIEAPGARRVREAFPTLVDWIAGGNGLPQWMALNGISVGEFYRFLDANPAHADAYTRARVWRAHYRAETIERIAEDVLAGRVKSDAGRVAMDGFKWIAARLDWRTYGEHKTVEATVTHRVDASELSSDELAAIAKQAKAIDAQATPVSNTVLLGKE